MSEFNLQPSPFILDADPVTEDWPLDASVDRADPPKLHGLAECKSIPADSWYARILRVTMAAFSAPLWPEL